MHICKKNKSIHKEVKTVCNSLSQKLIALLLVSAVGGTCTVGGSLGRIACGQNDPIYEDSNENQEEQQNFLANSQQNQQRNFVPSFPPLSGTSNTFSGNNQQNQQQRPVVYSQPSFTQPSFTQPSTQESQPSQQPHFITDDRRTIVAGTGDVWVANTGNTDVRRTGSLFVRPGINMQLQNGTVFEVASTAEETLQRLSNARRQHSALRRRSVEMQPIASHDEDYSQNIPYSPGQTENNNAREPHLAATQQHRQNPANRQSDDCCSGLCSNEMRLSCCFTGWFLGLFGLFDLYSSIPSWFQH